MRKAWKGEGVLEAKVLQYVPQEVRDRFEEPATPLPASAGVNESANIQSELEAANARLVSQLEAANAKLIEKVSLPDIIVASAMHTLLLRSHHHTHTLLRMKKRKQFRANWKRRMRN